MKRIAMAALVAGMVFAGGGQQGGAQSSGPWKWERKITLVCPWGVGGGADGTLRPLQWTFSPLSIQPP